MSEQDGAGVGRIELTIPHEGYAVTVTIYASSIIRAIERQEQTKRDEINRKGVQEFDLSKYTTVRAKPSDESGMNYLRMSEKDGGGLARSTPL